MNHTSQVSGQGASYPIKEVETQPPVLQKPIEDAGDDNSLAVGLDEYISFWESQIGSDGAVTNRILNLLIALTETMQDVSVAEAKKLSNLGDLQRAYMDLKSKIPVLMKGQPGAPDDNTVRQDMNNAFSNYMENVRANEGVVQDKQKSVQADINTRKDNPFSSLFDNLLEINKRLMSQLFR